MKIQPSYKLELVASSDETRLSITHVNVKNSQAQSTNGAAAVTVPVVMEPSDIDGPVTVDALKHARKASKDRGLDVTGMDLNPSNVTAEDGVIFPRPAEQAEFPNLEAAGIFPAERDCPFELCVNPSMLLAVARAMGAQRGVKLRFAGNTSAILVLPHNNDDGPRGVIMPLCHTVEWPAQMEMEGK